MSAPEGSVTWPDTVPLLMDCPKTDPAHSAAVKLIRPRNLTISIIANRAFSHSNSYTCDAAIID